MQVCPALLIAPHSAASAAALTSASSSTISASLPPHSIRTGVRFSAQAAITLRPVAELPVKASLSMRDRHSAAPVSPRPVMTWNTGGPVTASAKRVSEPGSDSRGVLAGLEDHRVAGGERVRDRAHRREDRVVPRPDDTDDAERRVLDGRRLVGGEDARSCTLWTPSTFGAAFAAQARWSTASMISSTASPLGLPFSRVTSSASSSARRASSRRQAARSRAATVEAELGPPLRGLARPAHGGVDRRPVVDRVASRAPRPSPGSASRSVVPVRRASGRADQWRSAARRHENS